MKAVVPISVVLLFLSSCIKSPYSTPSYRMPATFNRGSGIMCEDSLERWWDNFNDVTLQRLVAHMCQYNYELEQARERIEEYRALYQIKDAELFPQIDGIGQARHTRFSQALAQTAFLNDPTASFLQFGLDSFWEIDFWGRVRHIRNAQRHAYSAEVERMRDLKIILIADVARGYIELCAVCQKIRILDKKISTQMALVNLYDDLYRAGIVSQVEVVVNQQLLASTRVFKAELCTIRDQVHHRLAVLIGLSPERFKSSGISRRVPVVCDGIATGIPSDLLRRRPDIRHAECRIASVHEDVNAAIADWFPRFSLFGGVATESSSGTRWFTGDSLSWFIGPSVRWPIINFGRVAANIHVQESRKRQAVLQYKNAILVALQDVEDFLSAYCYTQEQLDMQSYLYCKARTQERLIHARYYTGVADERDYLQAKINRLSAQLDVVERTYAVSSSVVGLYKALGGGW